MFQTVAGTVGRLSKPSLDMGGLCKRLLIRDGGGLSTASPSRAIKVAVDPKPIMPLAQG